MKMYEKELKLLERIKEIDNKADEINKMYNSLFEDIVSLLSDSLYQKEIYAGVDEISCYIDESMTFDEIVEVGKKEYREIKHGNYDFRGLSQLRTRSLFILLKIKKEVSDNDR